MSKKLIIALGAALLLSAGPSLAQVPGLDSLGNMLGGASNDAAAAAAGAAAPATDAATQAVDHVEKGKKAAGHARNANHIQTTTYATMLRLLHGGAML